MVVLECSVATCVHNEDNKCCKSAILVEGHDAVTTDLTRCDSFDKRHEGVTNDCKCANPQVEIQCRAVNCVYNDNKYCKATVVGVVGHTATKSEQTECATFKCR